MSLASVASPSLPSLAAEATSKSSVLQMLENLKSPVAIDEIRLSTVPINKTIACESAAQVVLQDNWCDVCARSERTIFPASVAPCGSVSASSKELRKGLSAVKQGASKLPAVKGVKLTGPSCDSSNESVYAGSDNSSASNSDSDSSDDSGGGGTDIANQYNKQNAK